MKKLNKIIVALWLSIALVLQVLTPLSFAADHDIQDIIQQTVSQYYESERGRTLNNFWETAAVSAGGADLANGKWLLPNLSVNAKSDIREIAGSALNELLKGAYPSELLDILKSKQKSDGSFDANPLGHTWAMIALDAAGEDYNKEHAISYLLSKQLEDGGFNISSTATESDCDTTAMVTLALANHKDTILDAQTKTKLLTYFHTRQNNTTGGFGGQVGPNSNTTSMTISALVALGEDVQSANWTVNNKTPVDELLGYRTSNSAFGFTSNTSANQMSTAQSIVALCDVLSGKSVFTQITTNEKKVVNISVQTPEGSLVKLTNLGIESFDLTPFGAQNQSFPTALHALITALKTVNLENTLQISNGMVVGIDRFKSPNDACWLYYVNHQIAAMGFNDYPLCDNDELVIFYTNDYTKSYYTYFDKKLTYAATGDDITLTLGGSTIQDDMLGEGKEVAVLTGVFITVNGQPYIENNESVFTDANGQVTLNFNQAGEFIVGIHGIEGDITLATSKILVTGENVSPITKKIGIRIEGLKDTLVPLTQMTLTRNREITAMDALKQMLKNKGIDYDAPDGSYVTRIGTEANADYNGWMYMVNDKTSMFSMNKHNLKNGDVVTVYYGGMDTYIPKITISPKTIYANDEIKIHVQTTYTDWTDWKNPIDKTINVTDASILLDGKQYITDKDGIVTISEGLQVGEHILKISKEVTDSCPKLVRNDIPIYVVSKQVLNSNSASVQVYNTPLELYADNIDGASLITTPTEQENIKSVLLPQITAYKDGFVLSISQNTLATASSDWDGNMLLPQETNVSFSDKDVSVAVMVGNEDIPIALDKPVRLFIPGGANKKAGYMNQEGNLLEITNQLDADNALALGDDFVAGKITVDDDIVIWTRLFSTFVLYTEAESGSGNGGSGGSSGYGSIKLTVIGNDNSVFYPKKGESETVALQANDTPYSVLKRKLGSRVKSSGSGEGIYVTEIDGLKEFDITPESGWMYSVNGDYYQDSANSMDRRLKSGDKVKWAYTLDLGADVGDHNTSKYRNSNIINVVKTVDTTNLASVEKALTQLLSIIQSKDELEEFDIFVLAKSEIKDDRFKNRINEIVTQANGSFRKSTDLSKLIITAHTLGMDAHNVAGFNLIQLLTQFNNLMKQGTNAPTYALLAYDMVGLPKTEEGINTREACISWILQNQNEDGGVALSQGGNSDVDITAMALYALAPYQTRTDVKKCIEKAITYLSNKQLSNGGYSYDSTESSESVSQTIIALATLDIDLFDSRFVKSSGNLFSNLMTFQAESGAFKHLKNGSENSMATYQAAMALTAYKLFMEGKYGLFQPNQQRENVFHDINTVVWAKDAILKLYQKNIITGDDNGYFHPNQSITREQMLKMILLALQFKIQDAETDFIDITKEHWSYSYIATAQLLGLTKGKDDGSFGLGEDLSRQDLCVLLMRALKSANVTLINRDESADELFTDGQIISQYAKESVATLYKNGIVNGVDERLFAPSKTCTRAEAVVMISRALNLIQKN